MKVLLMRHGIAFDPDPAQWPDDRRRPLTPEGEERMVREASGVRSLALAVDILLSSPWKRAWQTAEVLHEDAGWPAPKEIDALEADRSPQRVLDVLRDHSGAGTVALVGHEPQCRRLASFLLTGDADRVTLEFKKGGMAAFLLEAPLSPGTAQLLWSLPPRILRRL